MMNRSAVLPASIEPTSFCQRTAAAGLRVTMSTIRRSRAISAARRSSPCLPEFSTSGKHGEDLRAAEIALDRRIVDMVTRNPAAAVRWQKDVGSIEAGKTADLFIITPPDRSSQRQMPSSPYRTLIDAT